MHNKFIVIDHVDVWTGSMNYTTSGVYKDNNNLIHIRSSQIAEDYTNEFEQMFAYHLFGPDKIAGTPNPKVNIDGTPVEDLFLAGRQSGEPDRGTGPGCTRKHQFPGVFIHFQRYRGCNDGTGAGRHNRNGRDG